MPLHSIFDQTFEKIHFAATPLEPGEYENCTFINGDFMKAALGKYSFIDCSFTDCDLSLAYLNGAGFREVQFANCKLLGLHFESCQGFLFTASFINCTLNHSSFYQMKLKQMVFKNCSLKEVDFTEADLSGGVFDECDLSGAMFDNSILEKVDFRTATNYSINPEKNRIKKAKFALNGVAGLLDKYDIVIV